MRPENKTLLFAWINAVLEHAKTLPNEEYRLFVDEELKKLEIDFSVVLIWEGEGVVLSLAL